MIEILKKNEQLLLDIKKENKRLESLMLAKKTIEEGPKIKVESTPSKVADYSGKNDEIFEDDVKRYLAIIDSVSDSDNIDEIISYTIPLSESYDRERLVKRLCVECSKRIRDTKEFIREERSADDSELLPFHEEIGKYETIKKSLRKELKSSKENKIKTKGGLKQ